jgi:hypothetical protein
VVEKVHWPAALMKFNPLPGMRNRKNRNIDIHRTGNIVIARVILPGVNIITITFKRSCCHSAANEPFGRKWVSTIYIDRSTENTGSNTADISDRNKVCRILNEQTTVSTLPAGKICQTVPGNVLSFPSHLMTRHSESGFHCRCRLSIENHNRCYQIRRASYIHNRV